MLADTLSHHPMASPVPQIDGNRYRVTFLSTDAEAVSALRSEIASIADVSVLSDLASAHGSLSSLAPALLVLDLDAIRQTPKTVAEDIAKLRQNFPDLLMLALTRNRPTGNRVRALGVRVLMAPVDPDELTSVITAALSASAKGTIGSSAERRCLDRLFGTSEQMQRIYDAILRLAHSNTTVLIRGESGSGKELAARAIVSQGPRSSKPFVSLNCAALPESLIEAELFGHERGAFTGADRARPGQIELAHTGTLFLDEIATLTLPLQSKLLRVLEDREVRRIGGNTARSIDFRLITATNENLEELTRLGRFREDLYFRINVVPLQMPPLREREGDIPLLLDHYLRYFCNREGLALKRFDPEALEILEDYSWPGNVRELENLVQRLALMVTGPVIEARHLPKNVLYESTAHHESLLIPEEGIDFEKEMERIEAAYLRAALNRAGGVKKDAGRLLKLSPRQMKYLCHKHGL